MIKKQTITVLAQNTPGVLYRLADLFLRRKINIESLVVKELDHTGVSKFVVVVRVEELIAPKIIKQIKRIIEVSSVSVR